ncbi:MAG: ABC transporter ATP-binding protein [Spirochaetaceae bacterium]|nr:ABC transporter ATP-binding protein [Spirochaetaceae bacterium]
MPPHGPRGPHGHGMGKGAKPKDVKKTIRRLLSYIGEKRLLLVPVVICVLLSSGASIAGTYLLKPALNLYIIPLIGQENPDLSAFLFLLLIMAAIYLLGVVANYVNSRLMLTISTGTLLKIRKEMFRHMESLPLRYFDSRTHGETMSLYTNDTDTLRDMLSQSIPQLLSSLITVVGVFTMMVILSPILTLLVVLMIGVMFLCIATVGKRSAKAFRDQQKNLSAVNGYIEEMIEGQRVVKVFCHERESKEAFAQLNQSLRESSARANSLANILMPMMGNLSHINYALTAMAGALMVISGWLDIGTIASFLQYTRSFSMPITQMSQQFNGILNALAGAERIFAMLDQEPESDQGSYVLVNAVESSPAASADGKPHLVEAFTRTGTWAWRNTDDPDAPLIPLRGEVIFKDVSFGYEPEKTVLHDINLVAKPGQKVALVGSTGSGKTTITNLLTRFYDIEEGSITYDGIPLKSIRKADLRRSLGMVLQDTHLFTGSVSDNIRFGNPEASQVQVESAARLANADSFIHHLEQGYDTRLTADGGSISQGQRQLLSIARAAAANPPVLILDEATSSVDTRTETLIQRGMDKLMEGRTVFVIAHRLSTIRNADLILVLEQGRIIERGNHQQLIDQRGRYYQLYTGMFELE